MESIKKNYLYSVFYQILIIVVPLITAPYLTRVMGAKQLGIYSFTNSIAYYFYLVTMLGLANYGNRTIAMIRNDREKLDKTFSEIVSMQVSFGLLITIAYVCYLVYLFSVHSEYAVPSLIWGAYVISGAFDINWFFWGIEKFSVTVLRNIVIKILAIVGIFILVKSENDLYFYIALTSISFVLSNIILWTQLNKYVSFAHVSLSEAYSHFKGNLILFIPVIAVSIYTVMDKIMLGKMSNMINLGFYDNIQKIMTLPTGIITALGAVMLPRMSNLLANENKKTAFSYLDISMQFSMFFSIAIACGLAAIAPSFTAIYFGKEFEGTNFTMELFTITIVFIAWANVLRTQYLIPTGKDKIYILSVCIGATVNVVVNLILIPKFNETGAVIGTILAEFTVALIQTIKVRNNLDIKHYIKNTVIFIIPGFIMIFIVRMIQSFMGINTTSLLVQIMSGIIFYSFFAGLVLLQSKSLLAMKIIEFTKRKRLGR